MNIAVNNFSGQEVYAALYGIDTNLNWCLYNFTSNTFDICVTGQTDAMSYMVLVPNTGLTITDTPQMASGVFLFSYNQLPNDFAVVSDAFGNATVQGPSFLPDTVDYNTIFNTVELTLTANTAGVTLPAVWADITNVDYFSTPLEIYLTGYTNGEVYSQGKGAMKSGRDSVFAEYIKETEGTIFSKLVVTGESGNVRILGPQHGITAGLIPINYWDEYVDKVWAYYKDNVLHIDNGAYGTYSGMVNYNDKMALTGSNGDIQLISRPGPGLAMDIFGCQGTLAAPNNSVGHLAAIIGAAFNRSTLLSHSSQPYCNTHDFYQLTGSTNLYASVLHKFYVDGTTYAFPFDDVCNGSSTLSCPDPRQLTINLSTFLNIA